MNDCAYEYKREEWLIRKETRTDHSLAYLRVHSLAIFFPFSSL